MSLTSNRFLRILIYLSLAVVLYQDWLIFCAMYRVYVLDGWNGLINWATFYWEPINIKEVATGWEVQAPEMKPALVRFFLYSGMLVVVTIGLSVVGFRRNRQTR